MLEGAEVNGLCWFLPSRKLPDSWGRQALKESSPFYPEVLCQGMCRGLWALLGARERASRNAHLEEALFKLRFEGNRNLGEKQKRSSWGKGTGCVKREIAAFPGSKVGFYSWINTTRKLVPSHWALTSYWNIWQPEIRGLSGPTWRGEAEWGILNVLSCRSF